MSSIPNLFIVGQPKSGTAALHTFLGEHPEVFMSKEKEIKFFDKDFHKESDEFYGYKKFFKCRTHDEYLKYFNSVSDEKYIGESTTNYLYSKVASYKIKEFNPNSKIIMMFRDPIEMIYATHAQYYAFAREIKNFKEAFQLEKERKKGRFVPDQIYCPSLLFYSERIKYVEQINRYFECFTKEQIKIIIFDDFKENNHKIFYELCEWLDINRDFMPHFRKINVNELPRNEYLNKLFFESYFKQIINDYLPKDIYYYLKPLAKKILWSKRKRSPIPIDLYSQLVEICKPEVEKFSKITGKDMMKRWGYN